MKLLPDNIKPDKYLGKGFEYLYLLVGLIILILIILIFGIFYKETSLGDIGSILTGTIGTMVALLVSVFTFLAFYVQYDANKKIENQFKYQQASSQFYTMLNLHVKNVESFKMSSHSNNNEWRYRFQAKNETASIVPIGFLIYEILTSDITKSKIERQEYEIDINSYSERIKGRKCFFLMVKDLHFTLDCIRIINNSLVDKLPIEKQLQLGYKIFFWGTDSSHIYFINKEYEEIVKTINERLNSVRRMIRKYKGDKIIFTYDTRENSVRKVFRFIPFSGHSSRLAHYYRHLYQTVKQLHYEIENGNISEETGNLFFTTLRGQMSNEEQLLLYYNYRIGFGEKWDLRYDKETSKRGTYQFLTKYKMMHNIPLYNTIYKEVEHPEAHFNEFIKKHPEFDLFEWSS